MPSPSRSSQSRAFMHLDGPSGHRGLCGAQTNKLYKLWGLSLHHVTFEICDSCSAIASQS